MLALGLKVATLEIPTPFPMSQILVASIAPATKRLANNLRPQTSRQVFNVSPPALFFEGTQRHLATADHYFSPPTTRRMAATTTTTTTTTTASSLANEFSFGCPKQTNNERTTNERRGIETESKNEKQQRSDDQRQNPKSKTRSLLTG